LVTGWQKHGIIHIVFCACHIFIDCFGIKDILSQIGISIILVILYTFIERSIKEGWVLYDSFKKSSMLFMRFADNLSSPAFICDSSGMLFYQNASAEQILNHFYSTMSKTQENNGNKKGNFLEMLHPNYKTLMQDTLKNSLKSTEIGTMEVWIKEKNEGENKIGDNNENIKYMTEIYKCRNLRVQGYQAYLLEIQKFSWKSLNTLLIICNNITEQKKNDEIIYEQQICNLHKTQDICSIFRN